MGLWSKLKETDKTFSWSFLGVIVGFIGICFAIYTGYFQNNSPKIRYEILTDTNIIELRENIGKLDILYDNISIIKNNKALRIVTFKIMNYGRRDILKGDYDLDDPLGFTIIDGEVVEDPTVITASNPYLLQNFTISKASYSKFAFSSVIFEKGQFIIIKLLIASDNKVLPKLKSLGKVAGVKTISIVEGHSESDDMNFWEQLLFGSIILHFARFVLYLLVTIISATIIVIPIATISEKFEIRKKTKIITKFKKTSKYNQNGKHEILFDIYLKEGKDELFILQNLLTNRGKLLHILATSKRLSEEKRTNEDALAEAVATKEVEFYSPEYLHDYRVLMSRRRYKYLNDLVNRQIVTIVEGKVEIDEVFRESLNNFIDYINFVA